MFGLRRKRAVQLATQAITQLIQTTARFGGLPPGFWQDPYVLGFLTTCIAQLSQGAFGRKMDAEQLGTVIMDVYRNLNPAECAQISRDVVEFQNSDDFDYMRAVEKAIKTVGVIYGFPEWENDPDVEAAREMAAAFRGGISPASTSAAELGGTMQQMFFHQVVRQRLKASSPIQ